MWILDLSAILTYDWGKKFFLGWKNKTGRYLQMGWVRVPLEKLQNMAPLKCVWDQWAWEKGLTNNKTWVLQISFFQERGWPPSYRKGRYLTSPIKKLSFLTLQELSLEVSHAIDSLILGSYRKRYVLLVRNTKPFWKKSNLKSST